MLNMIMTRMVRGIVVGTICAVITYEGTAVAQYVMLKKHFPEQPEIQKGFIEFNKQLIKELF